MTNETTRPKVFVTRRLTGDSIERLMAVADVDVWDEDYQLPGDVLIQRAANVDALLTMSDDRVDAAVLDACPNIRVVANMAAGYNNFDLEQLTSRHIPASNTPGIMTEATADLTFALILACARRIVGARQALLDDQWRRWDPDFCLGLELSGSTIGIIGTGQIGTAVAQRARAFNLNLLGWSRSKRSIEGLTYVPLEELLEKSDIVTLHAPLSPETHYLIGPREFAMMKSTAILINTSRGAIIDQKALTTALANKDIAAAGLDVYEKEPIPLDDPLLAQPTCLAIPHIGSATFATRAAMASLAIDNILAGLRGERLPNCLNPDAYA